MKSRIHENSGYEGVAMAVLTDCHRFLGTNDLEAARDIKRFRSLVEHRGVGYMTLDLPAAGKIFDRALAEGTLPKFQIPGFGKRKHGARLPTFLWTMWLGVFEPDGRLRPEPSIAAIACLRQFFYCLKKARLDCDEDKVTETFATFLRVDDRLGRPSLDWGDPHRLDDTVLDVHLNDDHFALPGDLQVLDCCIADRDPGLRGLFNVIQRVADVVAFQLGEYNPLEWKPKHGTGAVADARVGKEYKYSFPNWPAKLESVFPLADFGFANYHMWADAVHHDELRYEDREVPSRLITVPKDMKGPRLIAAEPIANQYCQQSILRFLVKGVHTGLLKNQIDFYDQDLSRRMALAASADSKHATIDLSHASDSVSCWLVERMFRTNKSLLKALMASRTSSCLLPSGQEVNLQKFTTMGAATTFPIQSIIYAVICVGVEIWYEHGEDDPNYGQIRDALKNRKCSSRVFGDDLIVPTDSAEFVVRALRDLAFSVNYDKSFWTGRFREACGVAAYAGYDVTQTYVLDLYDESRPSTLASVRDCANNLHLAGWWATASQLASTVPDGVLSKMPVVKAESGSPGLVSFAGPSLSHLKRRENVDLQRTEYRIIDVKSVTSRSKVEGSGPLLQFFIEEPKPNSGVSWSSGYEDRPGLMVSTRWVAYEELITHQ